MALVATRRALLSGGGGPSIPIALSPNQNLEPLYSFGWTAATITGVAGATYALLNDAGGQFSIGGAMLRLEKALGAVGTAYTISVRATAPGYASTTATFTLTVTNTYGTGLVERINALNTGLLWQDTARTIPVTANGQSVLALNGTIAGWQASNAAGPTYTTNAQGGRAGLTFNGTTQFLSFTTAAAINYFGTSWLNNVWTVIAVYIPTDTTKRDVLGWGTTTANYCLIRCQGGTDWETLIGSGGSTSNDGGTTVVNTNQANVSSTSSDGAPDIPHIYFQTNGTYGYTNANGNPAFEVGSTFTSGTMAPTAANIGRRATTSGAVLFKGVVLDLLFYNRQIGVDEMRYIQSELAAEWGFSISPPAPTYLDKTNYSLWWQDDFDGSSVNWTPTYAVQSGTGPVGSNVAATGWVPGVWSASLGANALGSSGANSSEGQWYVDPRNPMWAAAGISDQYSVSGSVLTMQSQSPPASLNINTTFNITNTNVSGTVTTNANFGSAGIIVGMPITTGGSGAFGGLAINTTYYIATIISSGANSTCTLSTTPIYQAVTAPTLTTASGTLSTTCKPLAGQSYLAGGMNTMLWKARTFGIIEVRFKMKGPQNGQWPGWWLMTNSNTWTGENDIVELYSNHGMSTYYSTMHVVPYPTVTGGASTAQSGVGVLQTRAPNNDGFHVMSVKWDPTGISYYMDGISIGTIPVWAGARKVNIVAAGSGNVDGTYTVWGSVPAGQQAPKLTLTVVGGAVTGWTIINSGSGLTGQPTWFTNSGLTTPLSTTLPGVTITVDYSGDPVIPMTTYEPAYAILNLALGSVAGGLNTALGWPAMYVDYVRWYKYVPPAPTPVSAASEVAAIVAYWAGQGVTMSASDQAALSAFIVTMKSYQVRYDTTSPTGITSAWDTSKLSLWDAYDQYYLPGLTYNVANQTTAKYLAKMNLKNPGTGDLNEIGAGITYSPSTGLSLPGTGGVYLNSGVAAVQFNNQDATFSMFLPAAPTNATAAHLCGYNTNASWKGGSGAGGAATFSARMGASVEFSSYGFAISPMTGHVVATRGYWASFYQFKNGETQFGGFYTGNNTTTWTGNYKIGSADGSTAGAAFSFLQAGVGRRLSQQEAEVENTALRTLFSAVGITVNV